MFNDTVDSLLSSLNKTTKKLEKLAEKKALEAERFAEQVDREVDRHTVTVAHLGSKSNSAAHEADRAKRVAKKICDLCH